MTHCLIILNYNGREHLKDCLPSALQAACKNGQDCPVVVVDNLSTEGDILFIQQAFPDAELVVAKSNDGVFSLNEVVAGRKEDVIILLNNDMRFASNFIQPLLPYFEDPEVFAVSAKVYNWEGNAITTGKRIGYCRNFWFYKAWDTNVKTASFSLDAGGGCSAFRRNMFVELGGFDSLYRPGYWEDTDLSYRAWKRGWKIIYEPESVIYHKVGATLRKMHGRQKIARLIRRNEVLFTVKNCSDFGFLFMYLMLLPWRAMKGFICGNRSLTYGIFCALWRMPAALSRRFCESKTKLVNDKAFLERISENMDGRDTVHRQVVKLE